MLNKDNTKFKLLLLALLLTIILLLTLLFLGSYLNNTRENDLNSRFERVAKDLNSVQTISLLSEAYDNEMACLAFESKLKEMDGYIWKLGEDIDKYRAVSEEFQKDTFYLAQKKTFNENEMYYFLVMKNMIKKCNITKQIVIFFYQNSEDCKKCDDQSFILTDINKLDDKNAKEIAIFSFDMDLDISTVNILAKYYKTYNYPCVVINEETYCEIQDRDFIMKQICSNNNPLLLCDIYDKKYGTKIS